VKDLLDSFISKIISGIALILAAAVGSALPAEEEADHSIVSLTYLYGGTSEIYRRNIERTKGNLTTVCPDYFEITELGGLKVLDKTDPVFIKEVQKSNIKVTPFLSNHWDRTLARKALANRRNLAIQLASAVRNYNLDGVDIDIENINEEDRENYTEFIKLIREALPKDKSLTVCVAANPWGTNKGWQGAYDYKALAKYVDHIFIMTYDEHYPGGDPGPVASLSFIEDSIKYALQHVPPEKIVLGIPFYGRYWDTTVKGSALTVSDIESLTSRYDSTLWYDTQNECARATLIITQQNVTQGLWGGKKIPAGTYDIWYENERSYQKKVSLVKKYKLKGVGSWALGQEPASLWEVYREWIEGLPFWDISRHWAQQYIIDLAEKNIVNGVEPDTFDPEGLLTRAQAAAIIARAVGLPSGGFSAAFTDTATNWAHGYISSAAYYGILTGYEDRTFRPDKYITRQELAVIIERILDLPDAVDYNDIFFSDVSPTLSPWSNNAIVELTIADVIGGYPDYTFRPEKNITRAETAKIISKALTLPFKNFSLTNKNNKVIEPR